MGVGRPSDPTPSHLLVSAADWLVGIPGGVRSLVLSGPSDCV